MENTTRENFFHRDRYIYPIDPIDILGFDGQLFTATWKFTACEVPATGGDQFGYIFSADLKRAQAFIDDADVIVDSDALEKQQSNLRASQIETEPKTEETKR